MDAWSSIQGRATGQSGRRPGRMGRNRAGPGPGPGPGGGGAGWARAHGPATQVPLSPPGPCPAARGEWHPKGKQDRNQLQQTPSAASTPLGAAILFAKEQASRGRDYSMWPISEGQWQKCRPTIGVFERRPKTLSNERGKNIFIKPLLLEVVIGPLASRYKFSTPSGPAP